MKIAIITSNETRHIFFRKLVNTFNNISVVYCLCEKTDQNQFTQVITNKDSTKKEKEHFLQRRNTEIDFFQLFVEKMNEPKKIIFSDKGTINKNIQIQNDLYASNPDVIISYGCSIIDKAVIEKFNGKFINIHLGLSPYYRGVGTNLWPLVNNEPEYIGVTYMFIDENIDTGDIIHQIRPNLYQHDNVHTLGNRLIKDMALELELLLLKLNLITPVKQWKNLSDKVYKKKDFDENCLIQMENNFKKGMLQDYLSNKKERDSKVPIIVFGKKQ
ncbi:MAG: hypothetical protein CMJ14_07685 [Pelagibacterales bacterium]|nr:hypothetical protein [Pelagibacterales bacterium]|tara:strand:- start:564 stop:1379 length:816 start_codon:yes stop_codon:yes gene_type:complete